MRSWVCRAIASGVIGFAALAAPSAASAAPVDLVCPSAITVAFAPGVTLIPQPVNATGAISFGTSVTPLVPCSSVLTGVPYTGGTGRFSASGTIGCVFLGLQGSVVGTIQMTWNNGDTSTISFSITAVGPVPVVTASVTAGALSGSTLVVAPVLTGLTGNCLLSPVTSLSFAFVNAFIQL